jgi:hypothetical protein
MAATLVCVRRVKQQACCSFRRLYFGTIYICTDQLQGRFSSMFCPDSTCGF